MPFASVEEWRIRIGSSWCALGRPFNIRAVRTVSNSHQGGKESNNFILSRTFTMSGRAMLDVLAMLMVLVLGEVRMKIKNCVTGLSRRNVRPQASLKNTLMIMIFLLQLKSFVQSSLLMKCGDIESNPGPGLYPDLDYDIVDHTTILTENNIKEVFSEVFSIQANYHNFGMQLGLPDWELNTIWRVFYSDVSRALNEVLLVWLKQCYNVESHGSPTWRRLVEAVDNPGGGNNHALAKTIASRHPKKVTSDPVRESEVEQGQGQAMAYGRLTGSIYPCSADILQGAEKKESSEGCGEERRGTKRKLGDIYTFLGIELGEAARKILKMDDYTLYKLVQSICETMAAYYLRQVDDRAWPPVKAINFINLALIKDQATWRKTVQGSVDEIIGEKETTSYKSMIDERNICNFTLLEGRPGSGKTVLMNKLSCDWANEEILKSKLVIFIPLRRLNAYPDRKLDTLLRVACPALTSTNIEDLMSYIIIRQGEGVVFAFDGLDEYVPRYYKLSENDIYEREDVFRLLKAEDLVKAIVFVTSRPAACIDFRRYAKKRIEVLGFLKPQINEYVHHYFDNDKGKAQQLVAHLEHHPNLMNMAYLPLHCAMLAFLYEDNTVLPETETDFYEHFTLSTLLRSISKRQGRITKIDSFAQLPYSDKIIFDKVCKLAFDATVGSKQVFSHNDIQQILPDEARDGVSSLGLVVKDCYFMRYGLDETYTFLHLTFQEYLAAVYIAKLSKSHKEAIINKYRSNSHFSVVWRFMCGMMDFTDSNTMDIFKSITKQGSNLFQIQCCYESQCPATCTCIIQRQQNGRLKFNSSNLNPTECAAIGYTVNKSGQVVDLSFDKCNFVSEGGSSFLRNVHDSQFSITFRGGGAAFSFVEGLQKYSVPGLLKLNLDGCGICGGDNRGLEGLKHSTSLTTLNLGLNSIGSSGTMAIKEILKCCTAIVELE